MVLALVFVLGLCTVGVGAADAAFADAAEITEQYTNAIKAMNGLKILEGYPDGSFGPEKAVTRAEAAAIIARIVLGAENAKKWPARATFDDVGADHWAVQYIGFCRSRGIIDGVGNNKFEPDRPVKQVELAKMLLAARGYGAKGEFVGSEWEFNVIDRAMKEKIIKNILAEDVDWDANATREVTSILSYNTMMTVAQVEVSKDTDAYVNLATTNGVDVGTYSDSTWGLKERIGVVQGNKASKVEIKGTNINGMIIETDQDEDAGLLGHQVKVQYRQEERMDGTTYWKAYFLEDLSKEATAMGVIGKELADSTCTFADGIVNLAGVPTIPTNDNWFFFPGTYVLDKDGKVLSYKTTTYQVLPLEVNAQGKYVVRWVGETNPVEVKIPDGAKKGDMLTVYRCDEIYTGKACSEKKDVLINQNAFQSTAVPTYYKFNNGEIDITKATNRGSIYMAAAMSPFLPTTLGNPELNLNSSYTLYFDAEGKCYAFSDEKVNGVAASSAFYWVLWDMTGAGGITNDEYGNPVYRFQVVGSDGTIKTVDYTQDPAFAGTKPTTINAETTLGIAAAGVNHIYRSNNRPGPGGAQASDKLPTFVNGTYNGVIVSAAPGVYGSMGGDYDFTNATFVAIEGYGADAATYTTVKPADGANIWFTYENKPVGTAIVKKVQTVWFAYNDIAPAYNAASYIYTTGTDVAYTQIEDGRPVNYYAGQKDGTSINIALNTTLGDGIQVGFAKYEEGAKYVLQYLPLADDAVALPAGPGTATAVRNVYVVDQDTEKVVSGVTTKPYASYPDFILNGKLYLNGPLPANGYGVDLTGVTFVKVGALAFNSSLPDVSTVGNLMSAMRDGYKIKLAFVEVVSDDGKVHTVGGNTIYVVGMSKEDIPGY